MVRGQRTKGNTKPSSSGRTAQLLSTSSSVAAQGFIGFSSLSSTNEDNEEEELLIDPELRVIFKKMAKKDSVTKVKALQEFTQLIKDKTELNFKSVLSQWPRIYCKLAIDNDWRVREATHKSQEQLVLKVGRNIAPHLKQMMAIWLTSQFDCYSPAATAAISSFDTAFPANKKSDALVFCKEPIINYIQDMLLNQTIQTVGEISATPQENQSKYNRLISNCLQGLTSLIISLPSDSLPDCEQSLQVLVNNNKFWKFAKAKDNKISSLMRSSWYKLISCFAQYLPNLFITNASKVCTLSLGSLDESDPSVASAVWECALYALIKIDDSWKHVNFKKAFYPQFKTILNEGGRGSASTIFPNLLPLLSRIPYESIEQLIEFHKNFFTFLRNGIQKTISKQSECNAIIKAYMECFRYSLSLTVIEDDQQREQFRSYLIENELLLMVNESITATDILSKTSLYSDIGLLWIYLKKEANETNNYQNLLNTISTALSQLCISKLKESDYNSFPRISRLFLNLFSDSNVSKKDKKIRFRRESDDELSKSVQNIKLNDLISEEKATALLNEITKMVIECYNSDNHKYDYLQLLHDLIKLQTLEALSLLIESSVNDCIEKFWTFYVKVWFENQKLSLPTNEKSKQIKTLIDIVLILNSLTDEKQRKFKLLNEVSVLSDPYILECLFSNICQSNNKCLNEWLKSETAGKALVKETSNLIHHSIEMSATSQRDLDILWKLISHSFSENSIAILYIEQIIDKFRLSLQNSRSIPKPEYLVAFTCRLASQLFSSYHLCTTLNSAKDLLLTIFSLNCRFHDENQQLLNAWKSGIKIIIQSNGGYISEDGIITQMALQIRSRLQANINSLENAKQVFECALELINTIESTINSFDTEDEDESRVSQLLDLMLLSDTEWKELERKCDNSIIHFDWLSNNTLFDYQNCDLIANDVMAQNESIPFFYSALSSAYLIEKLIKDNSELTVNTIEVIASQLKHIFIASAYVSFKAKLLKSKNILNISLILKELLLNIMLSTQKYNMDMKIGQIFVEKSLKDGQLYNQALGHLIDNFMENKHLQLRPSFDKLNYNEIITFQKYASNIDQIILNDVLAQSLNAFLCTENFTEIEDGIGKLSILHSCLKYCNSESLSETVTTIMETFCGLKASNIELFYYQKNIKAEKDLQLCCLIIDMFALLVSKWAVVLTQSHWDLILCSTTSWIINFVQQREQLFTSLSALIVATKSLNLVQLIAKTFDEIIESKTEDKYPSNLLEEWNEFHAKNLFGILIPFFIEISENPITYYIEIFMNQFSDSINLLPNTVIPELIVNLPKKDSLSVQSLLDNKTYEILYLPEDKEKSLNNFCPLLLNKHQTIALASHSLALRSIPFIMTDVIQPELNREEEESLLSPPKVLLSLLQQTDLIVDSMLSEFLIGDCCCVVEPQTDSFTYTLAYLLTWIQILQIFSNLSDETRSQFASFLRQSNYLSRLLENLFRLMPLSATDSKALSFMCLNSDFHKQSVLSKTNDLDSADIQKLSCYAYFTILRQLPASVRQWWNNLDRKTSDVVNKYTSSHLSGFLCSQELDAVQKADITKFKNMSVKARPSAREVLANYTIEDITIELLIQLPPNHPLGPVSVDSGKRVGVSGQQWRTWLLQLTTFLTHQNGSILDGLLLWKRNIDKRFEGIEECMICFYVLHGATYQLPRLQCKYCRKRYHSACLYKWFSTSNNSTCPLCRNLF